MHSKDVSLSPCYFAKDLSPSACKSRLPRGELSQLLGSRSLPGAVTSISRYALRFSSLFSTPIESRRLPQVALDSSMARMPRPGEAIVRCRHEGQATSDQSLSEQRRILGNSWQDAAGERTRRGTCSRLFCRSTAQTHRCLDQLLVVLASAHHHGVTASSSAAQSGGAHAVLQQHVLHTSSCHGARCTLPPSPS